MFTLGNTHQNGVMRILGENHQIGGCAYIGKHVSDECLVTYLCGQTSSSCYVYLVEHES